MCVSNIVKSEPVLRDINLVIEPGQTVALVGPTGAGKTSISNLVARFYDVTDGAVLVDGLDVRDVRQRSLRQQMGIVPQDPFLFSGSLADNIRFGVPDADDTVVEQLQNWQTRTNSSSICRMGMRLKSRRVG